MFGHAEQLFVCSKVAVYRRKCQCQFFWRHPPPPHRVCNIWTHSAGSHLKSINDDVKKSIAILTYKQWLLSMDRKTKIVHSACISIPKYQHKHLTYMLYITMKCDMWQHYKQSLLCLTMKTKVVQVDSRMTHVSHVMNVSNVVPSSFLTFRLF